jgi:adenylate cyclase
MAAALRRLEPSAAAAIALGWVFAMFALSWFAFSQHGVLLDPLPPVSLLGAVTLLGTFVLFRQAQQQRQQVREAFSRFVAPAVVERLAESPDKLVLGGETRQLTLMFCDLRDFTAMSEGLDAQGITQFMNDYLTVITDQVLACGGTVDKYMGDAVMAFWNAPLDDRNHARNATRAALAMVDALDRFNTARERSLPPERFRRAQFGIGLSTGDCSVGNLGSVRRFDYSAIGDPVNLASRLESLTKMYGVQVLAPQETRDLAPNLAWLELDVVRVKGRQAAGAIHTLIGGEGVVGTAAYRALIEAHEAFRGHYRAGDLDASEAAALIWTDAVGPFIEKPEIYMALMLTRLRAWSAEPEGHAWDPVRTMTDK